MGQTVSLNPASLICVNHNGKQQSPYLMFCPRCSQEQISEQMRFCSRCGFPLGIVSQLVVNDGALTGFDAEGKQQLSCRQRGIRVGALLMLIGGLLIPTAALLTAMKPDLVFVFAPVLLVFLGGLVRLLHALTRFRQTIGATQTTPRVSETTNRLNTVAAARLPAHENTSPISSWPRPVTAEMVQPHSITERTTRLLDEE